MPTITIDESGCRACDLCVEICPTDVLAMDSAGEVAKVVVQEDCIGCTSCAYICPSRCLTVTDTPLQRPFYRIEENEQLIARFVQKKPASQAIGPEDWKESLEDVSVRLRALGDSVTDTMGRGQRAAGRKAGALAAAHLPEMYEGGNLEGVLERMQQRFAGAFEFEHTVGDGGAEIAFRFSRCALSSVVEGGGDTVGKALLCSLFHEYWAGLVGAFADNSFTIDMDETSGASSGGCNLTLRARR